MAENTSIEWTATRLPNGMQVNYKGELTSVLPGHTFNPWWGCVKDNEECRSCYAETFANRFTKGLWGKNSDRRMFDDKYWNEPLKWNKLAGEIGIRMKVFCASMADVFEEHPQVVQARDRLFRLIEATPNLLWLILTKRPQNILKMIPYRWRIIEGVCYNRRHPKNVWYGTSTGSQKTFDEKARQLIDVKKDTGRKIFLSVEPMIGALDMSEYYFLRQDGTYPFKGIPEKDKTKLIDLVDWVICGGESGNNKNIRPINPVWVRKLRDECVAHKVPFFFKQWGEYAPVDEVDQTGDIVYYNEKGDLRKNHLPHLCINSKGKTSEAANDVSLKGEESSIVYKLGKHTAGRLLDGREWNDVPDADEMFINKA